MSLVTTPEGYLVNDTGDAFATADDLAAYSKGLISAEDPRAFAFLAGATEAIRRLAGWNIAPATDVTVTLDGGGSVLYLPSLKVNSVSIITANGIPYAPADYEWSRRTGNVRLKGGYAWPDVWGSLVVTFNSGYAEVPADLKQIVLQVASLAASSPTGATREQAGAVAMQWATTAPGVAGGLTLLQRDLAIIAGYKLPKEV
jgi:hypothetical protein